MKRLIVLAAVCSLALGCTPHPRYRTGTAERRSNEPIQQRGYTTNEYLRLGRIMRGYLGRPYSGSSRYERGIDCSQFVQEVFKKFDGRVIPRTVAKQFEQGRNIHMRHLAFGDLLFFRTNHKPVSHVGIYSGDNQFMHASSSQGVIISSLAESYWAKRYVAARRILEKKPPESRR